MKPNLEDMKKFKRFFQPDRSVPYQLFTKQESRKKYCRIVQGAWNKALYSELLEANTKQKMEIGMTINLCSGLGRTVSNVTKIVALFVDCDEGQMSKEALLASAVLPHMIVETSKGNFHAYWLIKNCEVSQFSRAQKALAKKLGADQQVVDAGRAMRMAGTINWKRSEPYLTRIVHFYEDAKPILFTTFIEKMDLQIDVRGSRELVSRVRPLSSNRNRRLSGQMRRRVEAALANVPADDRSYWYRFGMAIHNEDCSEAGYELWTKWSRTSSKFDENEQRRCWSAFKQDGGVNIQSLFWLTNRIKGGNGGSVDEMSFAEMFAASLKERLRYDRDGRQWMHFDGIVWKADLQAPHRIVRDFIDGLTKGAKGELSESVRRFRTTAAIRSIVAQSELLDDFHISAQIFDRDPYLFAVKNGVINLQTGEFRDAVPSDYLRRKTSVIYAPEAKCPEWNNFMRAITCGDRELYGFIRRALGYTLYGEANLQVFFMMIGSGGNGKGTMIRTVQQIIGDYGISVAPNLLTSAYSGNVNGPTPALAKLYGARMVVCAEMPSNRRFDEAFIKQYAGGDEITARPTYGDVFSFKPEGKLWLSANDAPEIRANDEAMWRRVIPIPFNAKFQGKQRDDDLDKKFSEEYAGILNWLIKGAKEYGELGLENCTAVEMLKSQMRKEADSVLAWLVDRCLKSRELKVQASVAYEDYVDFLKKRRRHPVSQPVFRQSLTEKGFAHKRSSGCNFYVGFAVRVR